MKVITWHSPRDSEPVAIELRLSVQAASWLLDFMPKDDMATRELERAVAAESPDQIGTEHG